MTTFSYDGDDRVRSKSIGPSVSMVVTSFEYDTAGRLRSKTVPGSSTQSLLVTSFAPDEPGRVSTTTLPGLATVVSEWYRDGRPRKTTGTAGVPIFYEYHDGGDGMQIVHTKHDLATAAQWASTKYDWLGRAVMHYTPGTNYWQTWQLDVRESFYNNRGQLIASSRWVPGASVQPTYRYEYDAFGAVMRSGFDVDGNGSLTSNGLDVYTEPTALFEWASVEGVDAWWLRSEASRFPKGDDATSVLLGRSYEQASHLDATTRSRSIMKGPENSVFSRTELLSNRAS